LKADAEAAAAMAESKKGPKKWGLKRSRDGDEDALSYGGNFVKLIMYIITLIIMF
jgi:hypothetical protein